MNPLLSIVNREVEKTPRITAVILGYNTKSLIRNCIASLLNTYPKLDILYVDNDSQDGSLSFVRETFPEVTAISSGGNIGYCGGNNLGIRHALRDRPDYLLILNPDTVVCNPDFMKELVTYLESHPSAAKAGPQVYLRMHGKVQETILDWPSVVRSMLNMLPFFRVRPIATSVTATSAQIVHALNGCCFLVRSSAIEEVGLYDEAYWSYMDEVDWDWRAKSLGWECHFVPIESIIHLQKENGYTLFSNVDYWIKRNTALWFLRRRKYFSMMSWFVLTITLCLLRSSFSLARPSEFREKLQFTRKLLLAYLGLLVLPKASLTLTRSSN